MAETILNTNDVFTTTEALMQTGTGPGSDIGSKPTFVYLTDRNAWYVRDPDDQTGSEDRFSTIIDVSGLHWRKLAYDNQQKIALFDDFLGDLVRAEWALLSGSDAQAVDPAIIASIGGELRLTSGDVGGGDDAVDACQLSSQLNWQASNGGLVMQARLAMSAITNIAVFVGFTDVNTLEFPIHSAASADTVTDNATDACGFLFDTAMDTDEWGLIGTKADTPTTFEASGVAPVIDTMEVLRVEVDSSGDMTAYLNGVIVGSGHASALTAATDLTPTIAVMSRTTVAHTLDVDYLLAEMNR